MVWVDKVVMLIRLIVKIIIFVREYDSNDSNNVNDNYSNNNDDTNKNNNNCYNDDNYNINHCYHNAKCDIIIK